MIDLTAWSLLIDILLMGSLMYLAYRLTRAESVAVKIDKVGDLEKTLRKIINDAEESSIALDQKLRARQKDLETLLEDLKSLEERVSSSFKSSNTVKASLERSLENAKNLIQKLASLANMANKDRGYLYKNIGDARTKSLSNTQEDYLPIELEDSLDDELENRINRICENNSRSGSNIRNQNENVLISSYKSKMPRNFEDYEDEEIIPQKNLLEEKKYVVKKQQNAPLKTTNNLSSNNSNLENDLVNVKNQKPQNSLKQQSAKPQITKANLVKEQITKPQSEPLSKKIVKETYKKPSTKPTMQEPSSYTNDDLESVKLLKNRELAMALLKRNIPIDVISLKTNISVNELLKMKDNTVSDSEINKMVTSSDDARLGVLSKMRREIATL